MSLWRYDTAAEVWSSIQPGEGLKGYIPGFHSLAVAGNKIYLYTDMAGKYSGATDKPQIWCYDPAATENLWANFEIEGPGEHAKLFSVNDQPFVIQDQDAGEYEYCRINLDTKKLEKVGGTVPKSATG